MSDTTENLYRTVKREAVAEFEEKRSRFIGHIKPVKSAEEAQEFIKEKKKEYKDATHNVFGYLIDNGIVARYSDDGEPQGTAGMPVLEAIRKSDITDVCIVVTRYFGGIQLGAGGLVRAYTRAAKDAIAEAEIAEYESYTEFFVKCSYSDHGKCMNILLADGIIVDDTKFAEDVTIFVAAKRELVQSIVDLLTEICAGKAVISVTGERYDFR